MNSVTSQEIAIERESLQSLWRKKLYREENWPKYQKLILEVEPLYRHEKKKTSEGWFLLAQITISLKHFLSSFFYKC